MRSQVQSPPMNYRLEDNPDGFKPEISEQEFLSELDALFVADNK